MFKKRAITSIVILALTVGFFALRFVSAYIFDVFIGAIAVLGLFEICNVFNKAHKKNDTSVLITYPILCYGALLIVMLNNLSILIYLAIILIIALVLFGICFCINKFSKAKINKEMVENGVKATYNNYVKTKSLRDLFLLAYPTLPIVALFVLNHFASFAKIGGDDANLLSTFLLVMIFVTTILTDTVAYLVGSGMGGKKLCPKISPNKTIAGAIGGLLGSVLGAMAIFFLFALNDGFRSMFVDCNISLLTCLVLGLVASIFAQIGDIFASYIKRKNNAKDYGKILPGHGGILDRVDGLIVNALVITILAIILF